MNTRATIFILLIVVVLGGLYFLDSERVEKKEAEKEQAAKIFQVESGTITRIEVSGTKADRIVLEKADQSWRITEPVRADADAGIADDMANALATTSGEDAFTPEVPVSEFGLDPPRISLTFTAGEETHTLLLGNKNPRGLKIYARRGDEEKIMLVESYIEGRCDKSVHDVRDKTVLSFQSPEVTKIEIARKEDTTVITRNGIENWTINHTLRGSATKIEETLSTLRNAGVQAFVEENPQPDDITGYGLTNPQVTVTVWQGEDLSARHLHLGGADAEDGIYARRGGAENVFTVARGIFDAVNHSADQWMDRLLLHFERQNVTGITLTSEQERIILEREKGEEGSWRLTAPEQRAGDRAEIATLLTVLEALEAKQLVTTEAPDEMRELDSPQRRAVLTMDDGTERSLSFGRTEDAEGLLYARSSEMDQVVKVAAGDVDKLFPGLFRLRNKVLLEYEAADVTELKITYPDGTVLVTPEEEGWRGEVIGGRSLTPAEAEDLIWSFDLIEMAELAAVMPCDRSPFGLDSPIITAEISLTGESEPVIMQIGDEAAEKKMVYIMRHGGSEIGLIHRVTLEDLLDLKLVEDPA